MCTGAHVRTLRIFLPDKILRLMTSLIIILLSKTMCASHTQQYFCSFVLLTFFQVLCTGNALKKRSFLQILVFCQCAFGVFDITIALASAV